MNTSVAIGADFIEAVQFSSVTHVWLFATPWTEARQASLSITIFWSLFKLMSIDSVMSSNHFILCHPLFLLPSIFPRIRVFSNELDLCIRWTKYWNFDFQWIFRVDFLLDWLVWSPCCPKDSQESSPASQFEDINPLAFCFLYSPALTTVYVHWEDHSRNCP